MSYDKSDLKEQFLDEVPDGHNYNERLDYQFDAIFGAFSHLSMYGYAVEQGNLAGAALDYFIGEQSPEIEKAGYIGGLWGVNTRIVDDVLDGDGCEQVTDRKSFLQDYISVFEGENISAENPVESLAFDSVRMLKSELDQQTLAKVVPELEKMAEAILEEDKSSMKGYEDYAEVAGGQTGKIAISILDSVSETDVSADLERIGYEVGLATQIADDIMDDDMELDKPSLDSFMKGKRKDFSTKTGKFYGLLFTHGYQKFGKQMLKLSNLDASKYISR